jgi:hypothetical protein
MTNNTLSVTLTLLFEMNDGVIVNNLDNNGANGPFVYFGYLDPSTGKVIESSEQLPPGSTTFKDANTHDNYGVVVKWNTCLERATSPCTDAKGTKAIVLFPSHVKGATERTVYSTSQPGKTLMTVMKNTDGSITINGVDGFGTAVRSDVIPDRGGVTNVTWTFSNIMPSNYGGYPLYVNIGIFEADSTGAMKPVNLQNDDSGNPANNPFTLAPNSAPQNVNVANQQHNNIVISNQ